jgi:hypothetical protein
MTLPIFKAINRVVVEKLRSDVELKNMIEKWLWQSHVQRRVKLYPPTSTLSSYDIKFSLLFWNN